MKGIKNITGKTTNALERSLADDSSLFRFWQQVRDHPEYPSNFIRLGETLFRRKLWQEASAVYKMACRRHPYSYTLLLKLGRAQAQAGKETAAINTFKKATEKFPDRFQPYLGLEKIYRAGHHPELAINMYQEIPDHNPVKEPSFYRLFTLFARQGDYREAIKILQKAIEIYGESYDRCLELGKLNFRQRNFLDAVQSFQSAAAFHPENINTRIWLGVALKELGNLQLAEYEFNEVLRIKPDSYQGLIHLAELKVKTGDLASAKSHLDQVDRIAPHNARALICRGWIAYEEGDWQKAIEHCENGLKEAYAYFVWEQVLAHRILAAAAARIEKEEDQVFHRMMADAVAGKDTYESLIGLAESLLKQKQFHHACRVAARILQLFPRNTRAQIVEAEACLKEGRLEQAVTVCRATLAHIQPIYVREKIRAHTVIALACKKSKDLIGYRQHKKEIYSLIRELSLQPREEKEIKEIVSVGN